MNSDNVIIIESGADNIGGYPVTYNVENDEFSSINMNNEYIDSDDLYKLSKYVTEFEELVHKHPEDIKLAVASIIVNDDKPIKIRRLKTD